MNHVKVPLPLMQEIVTVLARMPYASVAMLMPKIDALRIEADKPISADGIGNP